MSTVTATCVVTLPGATGQLHEWIFSLLQTPWTLSCKEAPLPLERSVLDDVAQMDAVRQSSLLDFASEIEFA